jgi:hypothetical protein
MGILEKLFGSNQDRPASGHGPRPAQATDEQALARYRYMIETAPPAAIERVHEEAFAKLTPEQRATLLERLKATLPPHEANAAPADPNDTRGLARTATRAELRQPGTVERSMREPGGSMLGGSLLQGFLGAFVGSMLANQLFASFDSGHGAAHDVEAHHDDAPEEGDSADQDDAGDGGFDDGGGFDV